MIDNSLTSQFEGKNCIVTGGAGFIGSNLSRFLKQIGAEVRIIDNFSAGRKENITDFKHLGIDVLNLDITNQKETEIYYKNIDFVFHHAAIASVPYSVKNPVLSRLHNVEGTKSVLKNCLVNGITKIIFASSSAIYGDTKIVPTDESIEAKPQSPYAEQKLEGESHCSNSNEIRTTSLRYFNVFGPYQDPKSEYSAVIPKFIDSAIKDKDLIIYGDGKSTRDFVFVEDVIQANLISAISNNSDGEVINIATGQTISIGELAEMIIEITGSKSKILHEKPRKGDILHSAADITKAKKILGYQPQTTLRDGLSITIDYFSKINNYD
jgi:UDP-glucose 4-epimerase